MSFTVTNLSVVVAGQVKADVTLSSWVSLLAAATLGMDSMVTAGPGGWTRAPAASGATCTHGPLAAGTSAASYLQVTAAADAPTGTPPAISADDGDPRVSARGTAGVAATGFPAVFAASGRYAVVTAGASLGGTWPVGGGCGTSSESGPGLSSWPGCQAGASVSLPGQVVWAGLYWSWAGGPPQAAIDVRGPAAASLTGGSPPTGGSSLSLALGAAPGLVRVIVATDEQK